MTKNRLEELNAVKRAMENGRRHFEVARAQEIFRDMISSLVCNAPQLVSEGTLEACWDLMQHDAEMELERLEKELEEA
jgi:hypothetical protein